MILRSRPSSVIKPLVGSRFPIDSSTPPDGSKMYLVFDLSTEPQLSFGLRVLEGCIYFDLRRDQVACSSILESSDHSHQAIIRVVCRSSASSCENLRDAAGRRNSRLLLQVSMHPLLSYPPSCIPQQRPWARNWTKRKRPQATRKIDTMRSRTK